MSASASSAPRVLPPSVAGHQVLDKFWSMSRRSADTKIRDLAILAWIGHCDHVLSHQVIRRFFLYAGLSYQLGMKTLDYLSQKSLIKKVDNLPSNLTDEMAWGRKPDAYHLTSKGRKLIGLTDRTRLYRPGERALLHSVQYAEVMLTRQLEGWYLIPASDANAVRQAIGTRLIKLIGPTARDDYAAAKVRDVRTWMDKVAPPTPFDVLVHRDTGEFRFLVSAVIYTKMKADLLALINVPQPKGANRGVPDPLPIELVLPLQPKKVVDEWVKAAFRTERHKARRSVETWAVPHFSEILVTSLTDGPLLDRYGPLKLARGILDIPVVGPF